MDGYVSKPIRTELLKSEIARLTQKGTGEETMSEAPLRPNPNGQATAVNLAELLGRVENDWELLRELVGIFREDFPGYEAALRSAIQERNTAQVSEAAHALKGMLANLSAGRAAAAASELEQLAKNGNVAALGASFAKFESETRGLLAELESHMAGAEK